MEINFAYYKPTALIIVVYLLLSLFSHCLSKLWDHDLAQGLGPITIVLIFLAFYNQYLWKYPLFKLINSVPNLNGDYEGEIEYHLNGQDGTKRCKMKIKQTCSSIKVQTNFEKDDENDTVSVSTIAFIKTDEVGEQRLYFYYSNRGSSKNGDTLNPHDGINVFNIKINKNEIELEGYYFTNRDPQTKGTIKVKKKTKEKI